MDNNPCSDKKSRINFDMAFFAEPYYKESHVRRNLDGDPNQKYQMKR